MNILNLFKKNFLKSLLCLRYIPNLKSPNTFNEKIQFRKIHGNHESFTLCSDKLRVKDYVRKIIGSEYIIDNYFSGKSITIEDIQIALKKYGPVVAKLNHDSGSVFLIDNKTSLNKIESAVKKLNNSINKDYGKKSGEKWYSSIEPMIIIEKKLPLDCKGELSDYKFHVFTNGDEQEVVIHVDFDRYTNHNRSWFNSKLEYLPFAMGYPNIRTFIDEPKNFKTMLTIAKSLAKPFSYVRIDLYNIDGKIYFGEMTFAHGSGFERLTTKYHDTWLGNFWKGDVTK